AYMRAPAGVHSSDRLSRPRLAMVGAGGGRSVLTADLCEELGLRVPPLPQDVEAKVAEKAPDLAGWVTNPVDQSSLAGSGLGGASGSWRVLPGNGVAVRTRRNILSRPAGPSCRRYRRCGWTDGLPQSWR